ncbi:MAG: hypothetical protein AAGA60_31895, partial [Cyanobacteria bacterium P01_E01_bin.42]
MKAKELLNLPGDRYGRIIAFVLSLILPFLLYSILVGIPLPHWVGYWATYGYESIIVIFLVLLYPTLSRSDFLSITLSLTSILCLFFLALAGVWNSSAHYSSVVGGLLPFSDANGYLNDARSVLEGNNFSAFSSRRPLFPGTLTALLGLTGQNLQVTIAILVAMISTACFCLVRELKDSLGYISSILVISGIFFYYRPYIGSTLTENLGLALGITGFACLWRGATLKNISWAFWGLFVFTLALVARAGAFFALPALIVWGSYFFRDKNRFSFRFLFGGISIILMAFLVNQIFFKVLGSPEGMVFSNFSWTLYGLAKGGQTWAQATIDYPGASQQEIYAYAFQEISRNPMGLVIGSLKAWEAFFNPFTGGLFVFVGEKSRILLVILSVLGLVKCFLNPKKGEHLLILFLTIGILASAPFIPVWDAGVRTYAPTIAISFVLPMLGLNFLFANPKFALKKGNKTWILALTLGTLAASAPFISLEDSDLGVRTPIVAIFFVLPMLGLLNSLGNHERLKGFLKTVRQNT